MTIPVYKGFDKFIQVGIITINSDRITYVDISYSFQQPMGDAERYALYITQKIEIPRVVRELKQETQYPFAIKKISKALADTTRLKILYDMSAKKGCIQCSEIMRITRLAQPSVSHHVKTLIEAGLIVAEKEGRTYSYILNRALLKSYTGWMRKITNP